MSLTLLSLPYRLILLSSLFKNPPYGQNIHSSFPQHLFSPAALFQPFFQHFHGSEKVTTPVHEHKCRPRRNPNHILNLPTQLTHPPNPLKYTFPLSTPSP